MGTHHDLVQGAVVLVLTMVGALPDGAFDALVGMTVHRKASFEIGFGNSMVFREESMQETFYWLAKSVLLCYCVTKKPMVYT